MHCVQDMLPATGYKEYQPCAQTCCTMNKLLDAGSGAARSERPAQQSHATVALAHVYSRCQVCLNMAHLLQPADILACVGDASGPDGLVDAIVNFTDPSIIANTLLT
jgi:hypothetical protein